MLNKYTCQKGECAPAKRHDIPAGSLHVNTMDGTAIPGCVFCEAWWLTDDAVTDGALACHETDELMFFTGCNDDDKNDLCGEILFQIENDIITITETSFLFIPRGTAHGLLEVRNVRGGILCHTSLHETDTYTFSPAEASRPKGTFENHLLTGYGRPHELVPKGFDPMLWIDCSVLEGAPYLEVLRFAPKDFCAPETHTHTFGEIIGFLGANPETADSLNGEMSYEVEGEDIFIRNSTYFYIPEGIPHSPIRADKVDHYSIHFSGGGRRLYKRN